MAVMKGFGIIFISPPNILQSPTQLAETVRRRFYFDDPYSPMSSNLCMIYLPFVKAKISPPPEKKVKIKNLHI